MKIFLNFEEGKERESRNIQNAKKKGNEKSRRRGRGTKAARR